MRAQSHAARRAPPSPWTTACARRSDSSRWPGTLPVPSVVPYATFVTCKCRSECTCGAVRGLGMLYCPWGRRSRHVRALGRPTISAQSPFPQMQPRYPMCGLRTSVRQYLGYMVEERERGVQGSKCIIKSVRVHVKRIFKISITLGNLLDSVVECTGAQTRLVNGS